ncbi:MAG: T9SS type A sorting domain-containing protein, partial [Bacteroidia bacterium]
VDNTILAGPSIQPMGIPAVTKNGKLIIAYFSYNPPQSLYPRFVAGISTDGGATISNSVMLTYTNAITITNDTLLQYSYNLSANPNNANNLVFAFIDKSGTDYDLNTLNTQDEGMTWSAPVKINTDPLNNGNNQDMLWANFSTTGKYGATWRDRRANSGAQNQPYKIWGTISSDGGQTFTSEFQLSQTDGPLMIPVDGNDFLGCVLNDTCIYTCWTDKRNNNTNQLFFNKKNFNTVTSNIENQENLFDITVYPNPNKGTIKIKTSTSGEFKLTIKDSNGKELLTDTFKGDNYKLKENLESGIYFITIESNKHKKTVKTVLNK